LLVSSRDFCLSVALRCNPMRGICPEAASMPGARGARAWIPCRGKV
jgi:hypothetical protein